MTLFLTGVLVAQITHVSLSAYFLVNHQRLEYIGQMSLYWFITWFAILIATIVTMSSRGITQSWTILPGTIGFIVNFTIFSGIARLQDRHIRLQRIHAQSK